MSALVIDTSSWITYFREGGGDAILEPALEEGTVYLPPVVAAELLSGRMAERARGELEEFLLILPLCQADVAHWFRVGRLRNSLAVKGLSLSTPDAHVAQCALDLGADLLSSDAVFRLVARHTKLSLSRL
ncbi:MAG TPA: PIN domain-containing protein [Polyangia bacterium]